jgi:hypothetical protein
MKANVRSTAKSRVSNGKLFADAFADGRSTWARRLKDLIGLFVADLGGESNISEGERNVIRRIATITTELELLEMKFALANGSTAEDLDLYVRCAGGLRRLLETIGLQRRARNITPRLTDLINDDLTDIDESLEVVE